MLPGPYTVVLMTGACWPSRYVNWTTTYSPSLLCTKSCNSLEYVIVRCCFCFKLMFSLFVTDLIDITVVLP